MCDDPNSLLLLLHLEHRFKAEVGKLNWPVTSWHDNLKSHVRVKMMIVNMEDKDNFTFPSHGEGDNHYLR